jgi:CheY-like chemotaxis protein
MANFIEAFQEALGRPHGYVSVCADNGTRALDLLSTLAEKIDLVLIDLNLKREDALTVTSLLKAEHPEIPILVLGDQPQAIKLVSADETASAHLSNLQRYD